jgi:hypothetical protein
VNQLKVNQSEANQSEVNIQNTIRIELSDYGCVFRTNAGDYWQGDLQYDPVRKQNILVNLRRVCGLPDGFTDLLFVGNDGKVAFIECKSKKGKTREAQERFISLMTSMGHTAGIARSVSDALELIGHNGRKD